MTAFGKMDGDVSIKTGKENTRRPCNIPHTLERTRVGPLCSFLHPTFTSVLSAADMFNTALQKRGIKADDINQHSLKRKKINVLSKVFIKGLPVLRS